VLLRDAGIGRILVTGIRIEQRRETTTRHGSHLGFQVDFITRAALAFAMTDRRGSFGAIRRKFEGAAPHPRAPALSQLRRCSYVDPT
jgi:nicotinamidase-related amidase